MKAKVVFLNMLMILQEPTALLEQAHLVWFQEEVKLKISKPIALIMLLQKLTCLIRQVNFSTFNSGMVKILLVMATVL